MRLISLHETLTQTARDLLVYAGHQKIFLLDGPMGSGKTTLIKQLCKELGTVDEVTSPTFSLINEYLTLTKGLIYHFDCYRIDTISEAIFLDFEYYFDSGCYCFIEWPSKIEQILPLHYLSIHIEIKQDKVRHLLCTHH